MSGYTRQALAVLILGALPFAVVAAWVMGLL